MLVVLPMKVDPGSKRRHEGYGTDVTDRLAQDTLTPNEAVTRLVIRHEEPETKKSGDRSAN